MSLIPVFIGILLNSMYDLKFSPVGTFWALLGVLTTSVYQILVHQKQKELGLDSMQLLSYQAPMSSREYRYFGNIDVGDGCWRQNVLVTS